MFALFFAFSILERNAPRKSLDHKHDLVFHINALIGVNVFGSDHMTVADVNDPTARPARKRPGVEIRAELEILPLDAGHSQFRQYSSAGQRELLEVSSIASARFDPPFRQMIRDEFG